MDEKNPLKEFHDYPMMSLVVDNYSYIVYMFLARIPPLKHRIETTVRTENTVTPNTVITPTEVDLEGLDFALGRTSNVRDLYVYSMQVCPHQQDLITDPVNDKIKESSDDIPPMILQNVHGYFNLRPDHPTRLNLSASWDRETVSLFQVPGKFIVISIGITRPEKY